ncbi:MAG: ABC transporter substrate-binding protein [Frankiaceae bacterium]
MRTETTQGATPDGRPVKGGVVTWACTVGFPPSTIFPFTPPERIGIRNLFEFQMLMYRPLYWLGKPGELGVNHERSLAQPPEWSEDGRTVTVTLKPWKWSNGEPICADNVMFYVNMLMVKKVRNGLYAPGYLPDNLTSYEKVADDKVRFTFDRAYSKTWVLMNQLTMITPMPKAWDRTADGPANASADLADVEKVYDYLVSENGEWTDETNEHRTTWASSPVWSVVNGPWRLKSYTLDAVVTFVPNEHYSGPNKPHIDEFRQVPINSDEEMYQLLKEGPNGPRGVNVGYFPTGLDLSPSDDPFTAAYELIPQDTHTIRYMLLNFDNRRIGTILEQTYFRQAMQYCFDQETVIRDIFMGWAYPTNGPVPVIPDSPLLSPALRGRAPWFDVERARQLLSDNGWDVSTTPAVCVRPGTGEGCAGEGIEAGAKLSFNLRYVEGRAALLRMLELLKANAAKAGIELELEPVYGSTLVGEDHGEENEANPRQWEMTCWNGGWTFFGHPTGEMLFKTGGGSNFGGFSDPRTDELIDKLVTSDDLAALHEYQDYLADQVPVIWTPGMATRLTEVAHDLRGVGPFNPYGVINPEDWYFVAE